MSSWPGHVLLTADTVGGVWTFALELAQSLIANGAAVSLATSGKPLTAAQRAAARASGDPELFESDFKLEWEDDAWEDVDRAAEWLRRIVAKVKPDLIHFNEYSHASYRWGVPVVVTGHSCVLSWFQATRNSQAPARWNEYRWRVERGLHSANLVTAPSKAMLESLAYHYGPLAHTLVIPNGREESGFQPGPKEPLIFTAARLWDEAKNVSLLARIAHQLPWPVYVAGDRQRAAFENVVPLGVLEPREVAGWMSRAAIYCLPARYEPFGLSVLEAAFSGCALVLGDIESLRENWAGCAEFVDPDDPAQLQNAMSRLIQDDALRTMLARRARARAREFTPQKMAAGYLKAYSLARSIAQEYESAARVTA